MERVHPLSGLPAAVRSRPFRFGVVAANPRSPQDWLDKARRVEDLGYASLVVPDNLQYTLAPLPALAMAAAVTRSLRVGTYVLANDFRNPVLLAKDAATLDLLSGGRLELGIGAGRPGSELENRMLGLPFDSAAAARVGRLREALAIIKPLLAGERASAHGGTYTAQEAEVSPRPAQQPRPPILIAGGGRQMLALAAREADIIGLALQPDASLDVAAEKIEWIMEAAGERSRRSS
jgi:probable F420-dependent oxidoreductase